VALPYGVSTYPPNSAIEFSCLRIGGGFGCAPLGLYDGEGPFPPRPTGKARWGPHPTLGTFLPRRRRVGGGPGHLPGDRGAVIKLPVSKAFDPFHLHPSRNLRSQIPNVPCLVASLARCLVDSLPRSLVDSLPRCLYLFIAPMDRIMFLMPPRLSCCIILRMVRYCFRSWFTSETATPDPRAMRFRRLPSMTW